MSNLACLLEEGGYVKSGVQLCVPGLEPVMLVDWHDCSRHADSERDPPGGNGGF